MTVPKLAWRLLTAGGRRGLFGSALTFAAVAVATVLLMFAVSANTAFGERGERSSWRMPQSVAADDATAVQAVDSDQVAGHTVTVVDLATTGTGTAPTPPGMDHFPAPGEVWVSPALADLLDALPDDRLADRFPAAPSGRLGEAATTNAAELLAVVGRAPDDPRMTTPRVHPDAVDATPIANFDGSGSIEIYLVYRILMGFATVLLVVPVLVFGGAAARLTVARRDQRLAGLRLIGATGGQVVGVTVVEAMLTAVAGAVTGAVGYLGATPLVAMIPIDGGTWSVADLWPGPLWIAFVLTGIPLLVGLSAVVGLRRVVVSPLGVARRQTPPGLRALRLLLLPVLVVAFLAVAASVFGDLGGLAVAVLLLLMGGAFLAVNQVGPWVVALLGRITTAGARTASGLLAGRRMVDDPRSAWRTVAGIAMTGFVAGFMAPLSNGVIDDDTDTTVLTLAMYSADVESVTDEAAPLLPAGATIGEAHDATDMWGDPIDDMSTMNITVPDGSTDIDALRTALAALTPGRTVWADKDDIIESDRMFDDIRTGVLVVLAASLLVAVVSAAVSGASSVLDRRQTYGLVHLSGTPARVLDAARRKETLVPLVVMGGGSILVGGVMALPFVNATGLNLGGLVILAATITVGLAAILAAGTLSRPLLRSVMLNATPRPD